MVLDILKYDVVGDITACRAEIASRPDMSAPITRLQVRVFLLHFVGRAALHTQDHVTERELGGIDTIICT